MTAAHAVPPTPAPISRELQQLWLSLMRGAWKSLAVVPTDRGTSPRAVTAALLEMAELHDLGPFKLIDAEGASLADGARLAQELASAVAEGTRAVVAVDSLVGSLGGAPLVREADAAVLLVRLGTSDFASVRSTIDIVGRERILGAVALRPQA